MTSSYTLLISQLLKCYEIDLSTDPLNNGTDVYTLAIDAELKIHLVGQQDGYLNILCYLEVAREILASPYLYDLLCLNEFTLDHPVFCVGINRKQELVVSARQPLYELDSTKVYELVETFISRVTLLREWLQSATTVTRLPDNTKDLQKTSLTDVTIK